MATSGVSDKGMNVVLTAVTQDTVVTYAVLVGASDLPWGTGGYDLATCFAHTAAVPGSSILVCATATVAKGTSVTVPVGGLSPGAGYTIAALPQTSAVQGQVCDPSTIAGAFGATCEGTGPLALARVFAAPAPPPPSPPPPSRP